MLGNSLVLIAGNRLFDRKSGEASHPLQILRAWVWDHAQMFTSNGTRRSSSLLRTSFE